MNALTDVRGIIKHMIWVQAIGLSETYDMLSIRLYIKVPEE